MRGNRIFFFARPKNSCRYLLPKVTDEEEEILTPPSPSTKKEKCRKKGNVKNKREGEEGVKDAKRKKEKRFPDSDKAHHIVYTLK